MTLAQITTFLFFGGFVVWVIRLTGRNLRAQIGHSTPRTARQELTHEEVDAIIARRLATPQELFAMSPADQRLLATTAVAMVTATQQIPTTVVDAAPPRAFCPQCATPIENLPTQVPWRCECVHCEAAIVLRRDGLRYHLSYTPKR